MKAYRREGQLRKMTGAIHTELLLLKQNYYKTVLHYLVF